MCNVTVVAGAFAGRGAEVQPDDLIHAGDFTLPCSRGGTVLGVLNACHWLPLQNGPTTWHVDGMAVAKVTGLALIHRSLAPLISSYSGPDCTLWKCGLGPDGLRTFLVGLAFFLDDFVVRVGRSSSASGVYMLYLSWMFRHRTSRHAVRPISLAPPGVDSDCIL